LIKKKEHLSQGEKAMKALTIIALLVVACIEPIMMQSQTNWKDPYVTMALGDQENHSLARPTKSGCIVVVWQDNRPDAPGIYAQRIDTTTGLAMWAPTDGVPVCTSANQDEKFYPKAAYDSLGGVIVVWNDRRNGNTGVYAQRIIISSGTLDPTWTTNYPDGFTVCSDASAGNLADLHTRIAGMGPGAYIVWTDQRNNNIHNIYIQCILSVTATIPAYPWRLNGKPVAIDSTVEQYNPDISLDVGKIGAVVVFEDLRNNPYNHIYAAVVQRDGTIGMGGSEVPLDQGNPSFNQYNPQIISTSYLNIVVWEDEQTNYPNSTIYAGGFDYVGAMMTAQPVSGSSTDQRAPRLAQAGYTVYVAWEDGPLGSKDIHANTIGANSFTIGLANEKAIVTADQDQYNVCVDSYVEGGSYHALIGWQDDRAYAFTSSDIYCQDLLITMYCDTITLMPPDGRCVTKARIRQTNPEGSGKAFVWTDSRRESSDFGSLSDKNIYTQKIGGACDDPTGMAWKDVFARWSLTSASSNHRFVVDDSGKAAYVVWDEDRVTQIGGASSHGVYVQRLDKYGVPLWKNNGIRVSDTAYTASNPDVCYDLQGGVYVIWQEHEWNNSNNYIKIARILSDGVISWTMEPLVSNARISGDSYNPVIAIKDVGTLGAWFAFLNGSTSYRYIVLVSDNGVQAWDPSPALNNISAPFYDPKIAKDYYGGVYLLTRGGQRIKAEHFPYYYDGSNTTLIGDYISPSSVYLSDTPCSQGGYCFPGYDLVVDPLGYHDAMIAYTDELNYQIGFYNFPEIVVHRFYNDPVGSTTYVMTPDQNVSNNTLSGFNFPTGTNPGGGAYFPSIAADKTDNFSSTPPIGGAIVTWNHRDMGSGGNGQFWVLTNRSLWDGNRNPSLFWPGLTNFTHCLVGAVSSGYPTPPKIAGLYPVNGNINGAIVWNEPDAACGGANAMVCQGVEYTDPGVPSANAPIWAIEHVVSPRYGSVSQSDPIIRSSNYENDAYLFWNDGRTGYDCVIGTKINWDESTIKWEKSQTRGARSEFSPLTGRLQLSQNYPNPCSVGVDMRTSICVTVAKDGYAVLQVFNSLGAFVSELYNGTLTAGRHIFTFYVADKGASLPPGLYFYTLYAGEKTLTKKMTLVP
jgi:hypothetical protein